MSTNRNKIRVILVDDNSTIHFEIGALLMALDDIDLVAQGYTGEEAVKLCDQHQPDIVLMDIAMPVMNGVDATKIIISRHPKTNIIAMTGSSDASTVQEMITAGAMSYVLKETHPEELASVIRAAHSGKAVFSTEVVKNALNPTAHSPHDYGLTPREIEILGSMVEGRTNPEIAELLMISQATVKFHVSNIFRKLDVKTRSAAIILASKQGLVK